MAGERDVARLARTILAADGPTMSRWTHKAEPAPEHAVDPHYETTGRPAYWVCHTCRTEILLDGKGPPITVPPTRGKPSGEPPLSSQP